MWPACRAGEALEGEVVFDALSLAPGEYRIAIAAFSRDLAICYGMTGILPGFSVHADFPTWGKFIHPIAWRPLSTTAREPGPHPVRSGRPAAGSRHEGAAQPSSLHRAKPVDDWMRTVALPAASGVFLDFGCGGQPYRTLFEPRVTGYLGADIAPAAGVELDITFAPGESLPLADGSIDTILSTQVLEHTEDPESYLRECRRLLNPTGCLIITVPMQWRHHEVPHDYLRFTRFGITHLLGRNQFRVEVIQPCGGMFALVGQILVNSLAERGVLRNRLLIQLINRISLALDRRFPDYEDTLNWHCIARAA